MKRRSVFTAATVAIAVSLGVVMAAPSATAAPEDDAATVISRLEEYYLAQGDDIIIANGIYLAQTSKALDYAASQKADGSWSDVDYADRTSSANGSTWSAYIALYRMLAMTQAYRDEDAAGYGDPRLVDAVDRALLYWDQADPGNTNWWETEIGESIAMGRISMFLGSELSPEAFEVTLTHNTGKLDPVGANGSWRTSNYLFEALATRDTAKIKEGMATIVATIAVDHSGTVQEAVQPDASFWAHGAQLYSEGYGMVLFTYAALWADVARGTSLSFTRDQLDAIAFYIVDGTRWLIRGEIGMLYLNYRPAKTTQGITSYAADFIEPLQRMVRTDPLYATAYQSILDGIMGKTRTNGVTGNKYFWRSEFSSHLRDDYGIFTRLNSSRAFGAELRTSYRPEIGNPVYWNAMGATAIQVNNHEYNDVGPAFDWSHYPGVTAPYALRTERGVDNRIRNGDGASFTGGVSNGQYGASVLTLDAAATSAKKSYFSFDDGMVALGTDIRSTCDARVHTTINQASAKPNATVGGQPLTAGTNGQSAGSARWAYNDEVGYVFAPSQNVVVSHKTQSGSWEGESEVSRDVFSLYIDHGARPESASYDYTVLPAATPAEVEAYAAEPRIRTLRNDAEVQAARSDSEGITMATFYEAGSVDLGDGRTLAVDAPSIVVLDERSGVPVLSVANPDRPGVVVSATLTGAGDDSYGIFELGSGENQGKTVTAALTDGSAPNAEAYAASGTAEGSSASALGDGDPETTWTSTGDGPAWVTQRLARGSWVSKVTVDWADEVASDYIIQTSSDGESWVDQARVSDADGGKVETPITPTPAQFVRVVMVNGAADVFSVRELTTTASVNMAIDSGTRASGYAGYNLVGALADGDSETRWRGNNSDAAWAQVDLGSTQPVSVIRLSWEAAFAKNYKIQLSDDGSTWRDAYSTPAAGSDGGLDVITLTDQSARFVRMQTVKRALNYGPSLWEFEVFADRTIVEAPAIPAGTSNLALGRPTTADSVHNNLASIVPSMATDGSVSTKWSSARAATEHWLRVDLESVQSVSRAVVRWEAGTSHDYRVEGSVDGENWSVLAEVKGAQGSLTHTLDFAPTDARYVRLSGLPATQYGLNVWELELYGGFTFECADPVTGSRDTDTTVVANLTPALSGDTYAVYSLDPAVARVTSLPTMSDEGRLQADLALGEPGSTDLLFTHEKGDEVAWCRVTTNPDTTALDALIARGNDLVSTQYTSTSWAPVLPALAAAKTATASAGAAQSVVDSATVALQRALDGLADVPVEDTTRPEVTLVSPSTAGPFRTMSIRVDATDDIALKKVVANVYNSAGTLVKSTQSAVADGAKTASHTASVSLPDGAYTIRYNAHDVAGNVAKTGTFAVTIDGTPPTATIKDGATYTKGTSDGYDLISFKLFDAQKIDKVELNGKAKDLSNNTWSDINFIAPGVFGAVKGVNTLVVYDVAGNTATYTFTLN